MAVNTVILFGTGATHLKNKFSDTFDISEPVVDVFPDDETYVRLPDNLPRHVYYLQSFHPDPNNRVIETLLTLDALTEANIDYTPVFPYFPYAKQDRVFQPGEPVSVRAVLSAFASRGLTTPVFMNTHFLKTPGEHDRFNLDCTNLNAAPLLLQHVVEEENLADPVVALPGEGAAHLVEDAGYETVAVETQREEETSGKAFRDIANVSLSEAELNNRSVIVLDDMIATGGTMTETCNTVKQAGADTVVAAAVHGLFLNDAATRIQQHAATIYTTDTVPPTVETVETTSIQPVIADTLKTGDNT